MKQTGFTLVKLLVVMLAVGASAHADGPIETDRPDFTESANVVPKGRLQIESGFTSLRERGGRTTGVPEALFRGGVDGRWEWRLGLPNYIDSRSGAERLRGFGDTYLGAKIKLTPAEGEFNASLIPAVMLPGGRSGLRSEAVAPEIKLCVAKPLSEKHSLSGMLYGAWPKEEGRRNSVLQSTLSLGTALGERMAAFTEYAGTFAKRGGSEHVGHFGLTYLATPEQQWDLHFGFGQRPTGSSRFIAGGFSIRL
ncbi:MAG: transporter [Armatimonas sp.]